MYSVGILFFSFLGGFFHLWGQLKWVYFSLSFSPTQTVISYTASDCHTCSFSQKFHFKLSWCSWIWFLWHFCMGYLQGFRNSTFFRRQFTSIQVFSYNALTTKTTVWRSGKHCLVQALQCNTKPENSYAATSLAWSCHICAVQYLVCVRTHVSSLH